MKKKSWPFAFLAGFLTWGQFALCHELSLPTRGLGYPGDFGIGAVGDEDCGKIDRSLSVNP